MFTLKRIDNPLVSVIIPIFNRAALIKETLVSVMEQTYENWECIIVDDQSTDNTLEVIKTFIKQDTRFILFTRPDSRRKGAGPCRNYALELSQGELIQFLDSDDLLQSNKLEEQVKLYKGDLTLLTCKWGGFEETSDLIKRFKYNYRSYRNYKKGINLLRTFGEKDEFFPQHVYLTPRKLINQIGFWNEELTNNDDAEFFTRVILSAKRIKFSPHTAVHYRYSGFDKLSSFTDEERVESAIKSWKLIEEHLIKFDIKNHVYVENGKNIILNMLKREFPNLVDTYTAFLQAGEHWK